MSVNRLFTADCAFPCIMSSVCRGEVGVNDYMQTLQQIAR